MDVYGAPARAIHPKPALLWLSPSLAATPLAIPSIGRFFLDTAAMIGVGPLVLPAGVGQASTGIAVPSDPWLGGTVINLQAIVLHAASPHLWRFTNLLRETIVP